MTRRPPRLPGPGAVKRAVWLGLVAVALVLPACQGGPTAIRELAEHPDRWDKKAVVLAGQVKSGVMVTGWSAYELADSSGSILVVTNQAGTPMDGVPLAIEGQFRSALVIEERPRPAVIEKRRWNPNRGSAPAPAVPDSG